jgi:NTE family protein/lysophospholipid hydrolase
MPSLTGAIAVSPRPAESLVEAVESDLDWVSLAAGETLFCQGDAGDGAYLIVDGRLRILAERHDGTRVVLGESGRGEMIGEMALLTNEPRSATVEALRDTNLIRLSTDSFRQLIERFPSSTLQIARMLVQRERRRTSGRTESVGAVTFAVLADERDVPLAAFCENLVRAFGELGPTLHLSAERLDALMEPGAAQTSLDSVDQSRVAARLAELEARYAHIVYQANVEFAHWTRRCVRQADRVVVVADARRPDLQGPVQSALAAACRQAQDLVLLHPDRRDQPARTAAFLTSHPTARHHHVCADVQADFVRLGRWLTGRATGLVLGGGGARGYVHIGVIAALREAGIAIDAVGGTSIGAVVAAEFALGWDDRAMRRIGRRFAVEHPPSPNVTLPLVSLSTGESISAALHQVFGRVQIEDLWIPYFAVSSDLTTGEVVVHRRGSLARSVRASMSVPGILPPVTQDGHLLVDGGVLDNLPTGVMQRLLDCGQVIGVDCNPRRGLPARSEYGATLTTRQLVKSWLNPLVPSMQVWGIHSILDRVTMLASIRQASEIALSIDLYLHPPTDGVGMYNSRGFDRLVDVGYEYALPLIHAWKARRRDKLPD